MIKLKLKIKSYLNKKINDHELLNYYWHKIWPGYRDKSHNYTLTEIKEIGDLFYLFEYYSADFPLAVDSKKNHVIGKVTFDKTLKIWYKKGKIDDYFTSKLGQ